MEYGTLYFDSNSQRYDILYDNGKTYGGLHCGNGFDVKIKNEWIHTRIEMTIHDEWYLVGINEKDLRGLKVRL